jgi:hypothetical protein
VIAVELRGGVVVVAASEREPRPAPRQL